MKFRDFRWIWIGTFTSTMAFNMQMIARAWLVLGLHDDSPLALSLVMVSFALPMTFVSPIGGALADRIPRKRIIMLSQGGNALMTVLLATLDITGLIDFWQLLAFGFVNGTLIAFNLPSRQALISEIVRDKNLMNAISLNNSAMNLTRIMGPAVAGVLIIYLGTSGVFYLIAGFYVFSVLATAMIRAGSEPAGNSGKSVTRDISEGFSYALGNPVLLGSVMMAFIPTLFGFSYYALMPAWAREALDVQSDGLGLLMMMMGIGALIGTVALASIRNLSRRGAFLLANGIVWGMALAIFSQSTSYAMALPLLLLLGLLSSVFMSLNMTVMQVYASPEMRGRMMSIAIMTFGVMPLSSVPFGAIAESIGTPDALGLSGVLLAVFTGIFAFAYPAFRKIA
ncbi:MAG: MFS transporter [Deltaproteobacteria bacterium]|nr:MFS transporter [Deltaproteobacteria bacterium]